VVNVSSACGAGCLACLANETRALLGRAATCAWNEVAVAGPLSLTISLDATACVAVGDRVLLADGAVSVATSVNGSRLLPLVAGSVDMPPTRAPIVLRLEARTDVSVCSDGWADATATSGWARLLSPGGCAVDDVRWWMDGARVNGSGLRLALPSAALLTGGTLSSLGDGGLALLHVINISLTTLYGDTASAAVTVAKRLNFTAKPTVRIVQPASVYRARPLLLVAEAAATCCEAICTASLTLLWRKVAGPNVSLCAIAPCDSASLLLPAWTLVVAESYTFEVTVTQAGGLSATASVTLSAALSPARLLVAGGSRALPVPAGGTAALSMDLSRSYSPDQPAGSRLPGYLVQYGALVVTCADDSAGRGCAAVGASSLTSGLVWTAPVGDAAVNSTLTLTALYTQTAAAPSVGWPTGSNVSVSVDAEVPCGPVVTCDSAVR
jgi:hypothetical protein